MKRPPHIVIVAVASGVIVLATGFAGYNGAGFVDEMGVWAAATSVIRSWVAGLVLCVLVMALHAFACRAVFIEYIDCGYSRRKLTLGLSVLILAHAAEIQVFGVGLYAYARLFGETLGGVGEERLIDYLYFSYASYTSLGLGDIYPEGSLRLLVGLEALTGLLMIGWSASMTVVLFRREWFD